MLRVNWSLDIPTDDGLRAAAYLMHAKTLFELNGYGVMEPSVVRIGSMCYLSAILITKHPVASIQALSFLPSWAEFCLRETW